MQFGIFGGRDVPAEEHGANNFSALQSLPHLPLLLLKHRVIAHSVVENSSYSQNKERERGGIPDEKTEGVPLAVFYWSSISSPLPLERKDEQDTDKQRDLQYVHSAIIRPGH